MICAWPLVKQQNRPPANFCLSVHDSLDFIERNKTLQRNYMLNRKGHELDPAGSNCSVLRLALCLPIGKSNWNDTDVEVS